jgi:thiamine pyrophosphate-dependent acetolactate synthase large subunit-like protein
MTDDRMAPLAYGGDAMAEVLRRLDFGYVTLNPGASFRGLHDSIVNYLGNRNPEMLVCLHEEHALAIAHGYAKATLKPLLSIVHANVGLMHAVMPTFTAWLDRVPVVIIGGNGPMDAAQRRPYQDWIHTSQDMGALMRNFTKWDDQPSSVEAALESIVRAYQIACTPPYGPTFVSLDATLQEERLERTVRIPDVGLLRPPAPSIPVPADVRRVARMLLDAQAPVLMLGRMSRSVEAWNQRVALAEALGARVVTDTRTSASFPTNHPLHCSPPSSRPGRAAAAALRAADVVLALDYVDLAGSLGTVFGDVRPAATIVSCSLDRYMHNGWSMDYQRMVSADLQFAADIDAFVTALLDAIGDARRPSPAPVAAPAPNGAGSAQPDDETIGLHAFCRAVTAATRDERPCYIRIPIGSSASHFPFVDPLSFLSVGGGGGIGIGPGNAVGAALALRGTGRLPVAMLGDGDFLMGVTALWTAVANKIPVLIVVANNRSYYNDESHQEKIAQDRDRPVERKWIGQKLDDPPVDIGAIARAQGAQASGPVERRSDLAGALREAIAAVRAGGVYVVDVHVDPEYDGRVDANESAAARRAVETKRG